ncbi:MAG: hypothetical protein GKR94_19135 [Gammaproteobacteria bacterium]|nr:hypothetical protein [Gammaproteobacteria bacterium]
MYRSDCERTGDLHVEHVIPSNHRPELEQEWTNFLLGCVNCNAIKGDRDDSRNDCLWPDQDDTEAAFSYLPDGNCASARRSSRAGPDKCEEAV